MNIFCLYRTIWDVTEMKWITWPPPSFVSSFCYLLLSDLTMLMNFNFYLYWRCSVCSRSSNLPPELQIFFDSVIKQGWYDSPPSSPRHKLECHPRTLSYPLKSTSYPASQIHLLSCTRFGTAQVQVLITSCLNYYCSFPFNPLSIIFTLSKLFSNPDYSFCHLSLKFSLYIRLWITINCLQAAILKFSSVMSSCEWKIKTKNPCVLVPEGCYNKYPSLDGFNQSTTSAHFKY